MAGYIKGDTMPRSTLLLGEQRACHRCRRPDSMNSDNDSHRLGRRYVRMTGSVAANDRRARGRGQLRDLSMQSNRAREMGAIAPSRFDCVWHLVPRQSQHSRQLVLSPDGDRELSNVCQNKYPLYSSRRVAGS